MVKPGLPPWEAHVRFRQVQTLVREGSPLVKAAQFCLAPIWQADGRANPFDCPVARPVGPVPGGAFLFIGR